MADAEGCGIGMGREGVGGEADVVDEDFTGGVIGDGKDAVLGEAGVVGDHIPNGDDFARDRIGRPAPGVAERG